MPKGQFPAIARHPAHPDAAFANPVNVVARVVRKKHNLPCFVFAMINQALDTFENAFAEPIEEWLSPDVQRELNLLPNHVFAPCIGAGTASSLG
jgi:hypothetical protein